MAFGSGRYINRVPECNSPQERKDNGMPFPEGDFICIVCEDKFDEKLFTVEITSLSDDEIFDSPVSYTDVKAVSCDEARASVIKELSEEFKAVEHEDFIIENCYEQE